MNKKTIILSFVALIIALGMSQSVMAKKIEYLGYQYNGKINKENIPEGKGTITMTVPNLINSGEMSEFAISGIFNGPIITNAYFSTTWLSYKGELEIKEGTSFVLKKGGVITTNAYSFRGYGETSIDPNYIEHYDITLTEDRQMSYPELAQIPMPYSIPFSKKVPRVLNPPSEISIDIKPTINKILVKGINGTFEPSQVLYYNNDRHYGFQFLNSLTTYTDSEGRTWKFEAGKVFKDKTEFKELVYPDGSYCSPETNYKRVFKASSDKSYFMSKSLYKLILPNGIIIYNSDKIEEKTEEYLKLGNTAPYRLRVVYGNDGISDKAESYVNGEREKIQVNRDTELEIYKGDGSTFSDYGRIKQIFNDSILPYLTITEGCTVNIVRYEPDPDRKDLDIVYTALEYKDGVVRTEDQINKENDRIATEKAAVYNKSIASFKKKYGFDPSIDNVRAIVKVGRSVLGVIDARNEWLSEYGNKLDQISVKLVKDNGASKCYEFYSGWGAFYCGYFWTRNDVITSIYWGPKRFR